MSSSTAISLARQRLQRANTGLNGRPTSAGPEADSTEASSGPRPTTPDNIQASPTPTRKTRVPSRAVDLSPAKQAPPPSNRGPPTRQTSVKAPAAPPPVLTAVNSSRQQTEPQRASGPAGAGPLSSQPLLSARSGRLPSGAIPNGEPGHDLKPISTRSMSRGEHSPLNVMTGLHTIMHGLVSRHVRCCMHT